jgi:hypothetical protein
MSNNGTGIARIVNGRPTEPQVRKLMDAFGNTPRGSTITYGQIEGVIGERRGSDRWTTLVGKFKERMLSEKGLHLEVRVNTGYEAVPAGDQLRSVKRIWKSAGRRFSKGIKVAEATPDAELNETEKSVKLHSLTFGSQLLQNIRSAAKLPAVQIRATETLPRARP